MRFGSLIGVTLGLALGCGTSTESDNGVAGGAAGQGSGGDSGEGGGEAGGAGGSSDGGSGTGGNGSGGENAGGSGSNEDCREVQCLRPYECVPECGSDDVLNNGCCPCPEGRIDLLSCAGASGEGSGGAGGTENCREVNCFRPYECVPECGSDDVLNNGCCPCPEGRIDVLSCGGAGGA